MSDPTLSDILITLKILLLQGHPAAFLSSRNNWHSIRDKPHRDLVSKHFLQMFFHPDQVNQKHFRDQHLELSDSPTNEEAYNYFKFVKFLWFPRFLTSYFPLWFHRHEIMFSFYRPLFHRSLIQLPSPLKYQI